MQPVPLVFSCDTEDYETPAADDAELLWARLFAGHGVRACFCVVGEEARALRDRGRRDVLEALGGHEIASHSDMHSAHPTPAEYLEGLTWEEGARRFLAEEGRGLHEMRATFGQQPSAWCKPGNSWGPVVPYAAGLLGMPVFCDAPFEWAPGHPMRYAGGLLLAYHTSFDRYFAAPGGERLARMRADFETLLASRQAAAERDGGPPGAIVMYTHPCRTVTAAFSSTFTGGRQTPRAEWRPAPLRPRREVQALVRDFDAFLGWVGELRSSGRVVLTTYRELHETHRRPPAPWLSAAEVAAIAEALAGDEAPLEPRHVAGQWLSPADAFGVVVWALAHRSETGGLPSGVPVRRLLGPLEAPGGGPGDGLRGAGAADGASETRGRGGATLPVGDVLGAAVAASATCSEAQAVPDAVRVGGVTLGPGQFLRLAARTLLAQAAGAGAGDRHAAPDTPIALPSGGDGVALAGRADFARLRFRDTWSVFPPAFEGRRLVEQARRQAWSGAPA